MIRFVTMLAWRRSHDMCCSYSWFYLCIVLAFKGIKKHASSFNINSNEGQNPNPKSSGRQNIIVGWEFWVRNHHNCHVNTGNPLSKNNPAYIFYICLRAQHSLEDTYLRRCCFKINWLQPTRNPKLPTGSSEIHPKLRVTSQALFLSM